MALVEEVNRVIGAGLPERNVVIERVPYTLLMWRARDQMWEFLQGTARQGETVHLDAGELVVFEDYLKLIYLLRKDVLAKPGQVQWGERGIVIGHEIREALHALQRRERLEYGGGVDFELIMGRPEVERVVAYLGSEGVIPLEVTQLTRDVEVFFHTHPGEPYASPSVGDLSFYFSRPQQAQVIVGREDMVILVKTPRTPKAVVEEQVVPTLGAPVDPILQGTFKGSPNVGQMTMTEFGAQAKDEWLRREMGLHVVRVPRKHTGPVDLKLARVVAG